VILVRLARRYKKGGRVEATPAPIATLTKRDSTMPAKQRASVADKKTQRCNLQLGTDAVERLMIHAIKSKKSPGQLVTELIELHLRQWKVQSNAASRTAPEMSSGSAESNDQDNESEKKAA
jgi:hypothetical protein